MELIKLLSKLISEVGFPAVVCIYLLTRVENTVRSLDKSIGDLSRNIDSLIRVKRED